MRNFWSATLTLSGAIIGAGILGLPYVFSRAGFLSGTFWLVFLGLIVLYVNLCLGEVFLRTKKKHQLTGYAELYLGKKAKWVMLFAMLFGIYSALLAYLIGEGQSLSIIFTGSADYSFVFSIGFWFLMSLLLREGLRGLKRVEGIGAIFIVLIVLGIFVYFLPKISLDNISFFGRSSFLFPFGVILFALMGFSAIPEVGQEIYRQKNLLKKAIFLGVSVPLVLYFLFSFAFVGRFGENVGEVATLSGGVIVNLLGVFTMLTSYFVLSFVLRDLFLFDYDNKSLSFIFSTIIPLVLYLVVRFLRFDDFVSVLGVGGVVSGGITGIMVLLINLESKKSGQRDPEFKVPINWFVLFVLSVIFAGGIFQHFLL